MVVICPPILVPKAELVEIKFGYAPKLGPNDLTSYNVHRLELGNHIYTDRRTVCGAGGWYPRALCGLTVL